MARCSSCAARRRSTMALTFCMPIQSTITPTPERRSRTATSCSMADLTTSMSRPLHATYNVRAESGRFEHVVGTTGMQLRGKRMILTTANPFAFTGRVVEKTGPDHYLVYDGTITTCELPRPKWEFNAHKIIVEVGGNATIYHSTFRIEGVPVFYFPFATHPVEREPRQTGLLIPNVGSSSIKGTILRRLVLLGHQSQHGRHCGGRIFHPARLGAADRVSCPAQRKVVHLSELFRSF